MTLSEEQIKEISIEYLKKFNIYNFDQQSIYKEIQKIAIGLKIIENAGDKSLNDEDFLKVMDEIWNFIIEGYIAPGKNSNNNWFPHAHITEKGMNFRKKTNKKA